MTISKFVVGLAATALFTAPANAGTLVVAGDSTIGARFATAVSTGIANLQGNIAFQTNLLGGGTNAAIYRFSVINSFPNPPIGQQVATAYNTLGFSASTFDGAITGGLLANQDLLVVLGRENAFTAGETTAIRDFLFAGGNVLLAGESNNIGTGANNSLNGLLTGLGSAIRLNQTAVDPSDRFATGGDIAADPLTAGVTSFGYGFTTTLTGGKTLFRTDGGLSFIATENLVAPVPEPATWAMLILGFGMVGGALGRAPRAAKFARAAA